MMNDFEAFVKEQYGLDLFQLKYEVTDCLFKIFQMKIKKETKTMRFILNGCDISFIAEAPEDMTVKQLVEQASRIVPDWCACGICDASDCEGLATEVYFDYNNVWKANDGVSCSIKGISNE